MQTSREQRYHAAVEKVKKLKGFYSHLLVYLIFVGIFIFLNFKTGGFFWALFPIVGWGLGVMGHASDTFDWNPFFGKKWEAAKIKEFMDQDQNTF